MEKIKIVKTKIVNWIKAHKAEFAILMIILLVASFMRLYRIADYMTFLGDEGRDAILVRRLLVNGDIILIGPGTSIGNMYLGPLYYYFMAPAMLLSGLSPVGPSVLIALLGIITVGFVWFFIRELFPTKGINFGALAGAFLYAISPTVIIYSRSSWNPNIMPFFSLLSIYSIWRVFNKKELYWLPIMGIAFAFVMQSHYLGLLLVPVLGVFWLWALKNIGIKKSKKFMIYSLIGLVLFLLLMSPLAIFDIRHNFINFNAMKKFFTERQTTVSAKPWHALPTMWPIFVESVTRLVGGRVMALGAWLAVGLSSALLILVGARKRIEKVSYQGFLLIVTWIFFALIGLGVYKQQVYDHYYGFFFTAPFILLGGLFTFLINKGKLRGLWIVVTAVIVIAFFNFSNSPLKSPPNMQLTRAREVAGVIAADADGEKFNLAVIAERNYEDGYQFFLEKWNTRVTDIDPLNTKDTIANTLYVVCELPKEKCDPTHNPKAEVANFGWSKVEGTWEVFGVTVYKLIHTS